MAIHYREVVLRFLETAIGGCCPHGDDLIHLQRIVESFCYRGSSFYSVFGCVMPTYLALIDIVESTPAVNVVSVHLPKGRFNARRENLVVLICRLKYHIYWHRRPCVVRENREITGFEPRPANRTAKVTECSQLFIQFVLRAEIGGVSAKKFRARIIMD